MNPTYAAIARALVEVISLVFVVSGLGLAAIGFIIGALGSSTWKP